MRQLDALINVGGDAAAHGHHHVGAGQVHQLAGLLDDLADTGVQVGLAQGNLGVDDLHGVGLGLVIGVLLHHAGTDGGHGGTEAGANDGSHQVAAEGGTGHLQVTVGHIPVGAVHVQSGALTQELHILGHIHI